MHSRKRLLVGSAVAALTLFTASVQAQTTIAQWDFDNGSAGVAFSATPATDSSGNGYTMFGYNETYGPSYGTDTVSGTGLSLRSAAQDGYTAGATGLNEWRPQQWTIELSVKLDSTAGWNTIIGRDGTPNHPSGAGAESTFYFQNNGIDDRFRLNFFTVGGQRLVMDSDFVPAAGQWYHVAMVSDGVNAMMYVDKLDGNGYQLSATGLLTGATAADNALASSDGLWTFGRGWYNGGFVDQITGNLDDIRFTDGALAPSAFLHATAIPEPASAAGLAGLALLGMAASRRRRGGV